MRNFFFEYFVLCPFQLIQNFKVILILLRICLIICLGNILMMYLKFLFKIELCHTPQIFVIVLIILAII